MKNKYNIIIHKKNENKQVTGIDSKKIKNIENKLTQLN